VKLLQEIWKSIDGYKSIYEVSNLGNVRSLDRIDFAGRHLKGKLFSTNAKCGDYVTVRLTQMGMTQTHRIHRLVAETFIPNPLNLPEVNHIDGNKQNNCVENLEWCDYSENIKHAYKMNLHKPKRKLQDVEIAEILKSKGNVSCTKLAKTYGVSFQWICEIWKVGGRP
jgi:hypothetical protein